MHRPSNSLVAIALAITLLPGCRAEVPTPAGTQSSNAPTSEESTPQMPASMETPFEVESDFTPLNRDQFDSFGTDAQTWSTTTDGIACSGKPRGYLHTQQTFEDFTLRLEYRFSRPASLKDETKFKGNTGILVYITGEHQLWPESIEVQGKNSQMAAIKENGGAQPVAVEDNDAERQRVRKPVGEWNAIEIVSSAGALHVSLNGTLISVAQAGTLRAGQIGIQSEVHPFEIRRMRIRKE